MKILIDLNHPAHFHYCKNFIKESQLRGHQICITTRERYPLLELLENENLEYINRGRGGSNMISKTVYLFKGSYKVFIAALKFKPDVFLAFNSPYATHIGWIFRKPSMRRGRWSQEENIAGYGISPTLRIPR